MEEKFMEYDTQLAGLGFDGGRSPRRLHVVFTSFLFPSYYDAAAL